MPLSLSVRLKDGKKVRDALARIDLKSNPAVLGRGLRVSVERIRDKAEEHLKSGRSGLRRQSGTLFDSIQTDISQIPARASAGTEVFYGSFWEYGTPRNRPRPFLTPALDAVSPEIPDIFVREWERAWDASA